MYNAYKVQHDDSREAQAAVSEQSLLALGIQVREVSDRVLLDALATLSKTNGHAVVQHGARLAVVGELLVCMLTHLPNAMRADIAAAFRDRIEDLLSLGDDRCLPEKYHSALLTEVNRYLNALRPG
ncbi:hypothetical protein DSC91_001945 [Paraburkholderia caffeinilytica]|uniref:Uncharacterized protein n=1 Tax=Paraburkholderia caffeinilytica TaxID=1761016 RepID=A0ABQ1MF00_9BURK|nr:hypothetical protein [Paraburkholderia caffeinilytica]AXL49948.1 hypothetical protein DSC91_001945 [Paraburkholderia caffeinilytica]GGC39070.1 hypothetical protein GCM10011400_27220 [Paraburkholderia caffeinilytica]CAB3786409.1 hypothetical protein LMG28690_02227 [Paraburkholderia caffeinilytica]